MAGQNKTGVIVDVEIFCAEWDIDIVGISILDTTEPYVQDREVIVVYLGGLSCAAAVGVAPNNAV